MFKILKGLAHNAPIKAEPGGWYNNLPYSASGHTQFSAASEAVYTVKIRHLRKYIVSLKTINQLHTEYGTKEMRRDVP